MIISGVEISSAPGMRTQLGRSRADESQLWAWGRNNNGQLGISDINHRSSPIQTIAGGINWSKISAGGYHTVAIKSDNTLWTWGRNESGNLGDNTTIHRSSPVQTIAGGSNWSSVAGGYSITGAIKTDGTLWVWGKNNYGQLGDNSITNWSSPVQTIAGGSNWSSFYSGGASFSGGIKTDGTLWVWGRNDLSLLGDNTQIHRSSPVQTIAGGTNWKQAAGGTDHTAAIKTDGTLWVWGRNINGQLGINSTTAPVSSPIQTISGGTNWRTLATGIYNTMAIKTDGTLWGWGWNPYGVLGDNSTIWKSSPVQTVAGGTNWAQVSTGYNTAAIKTDGTLWAWGRNSYGQLGDNTVIGKSSPVQTIASGSNWATVSVGFYQHMLTIRTQTYAE